MLIWGERLGKIDEARARGGRLAFKRRTHFCRVCGKFCGSIQKLQAHMWEHRERRANDHTSGEQ